MTQEYRIDENGCWRWLGKIMPKGYGYIGSYQHRAHRVMYERLVGPIPKGLWVLHRCDVKDCVNPDHLYTGTRADNARDSVERGQSRSPKILEALKINVAKAQKVSAKVRSERAAEQKADYRKRQAEYWNRYRRNKHLVSSSQGVK
jgi:hypothetical protein